MSGRDPQVLLLSPGAKVGLAQAWVAAIKTRNAAIAAWETDRWSPAAKLCDELITGGGLDDPVELDRLCNHCLSHPPQLVVPTRHADLAPLASVAGRLREKGVAVAVSSTECIELCIDKAATHAWLVGGGFPTPEQATVADWEKSPLRDGFPLMAKQPRGSGSSGTRWCDRPADLAGLPDDWLLQTVAPGSEFTVNVYLDRKGHCVCAIPHERLLVHEGEVVRGRTRRHPTLMQLATSIATQLPGARGPLNIQIFWDEPSERATVIEINPRFGGGYPLAHRAGGRFVEWLLTEYLDGKAIEPVDNWEANLLMVRYREATFFSGATED